MPSFIQPQPKKSEALCLFLLTFKILHSMLSYYVIILKIISLLLNGKIPALSERPTQLGQCYPRTALRFLENSCREILKPGKLLQEMSHCHNMLMISLLPHKLRSLHATEFKFVELSGIKQVSSLSTESSTNTMPSHLLGIQDIWASANWGQKEKSHLPNACIYNS